MRKLRLAGIAGLAIAAFAIPASIARADTFVISCPDHYEPVPTMAAPPEDQNKDTNNNAFVCAKGPQGSNEHFNVKDDHGATLSPTQWNITGYGTFVVWYATGADASSLDPTPLDVVDDLP